MTRTTLSLALLLAVPSLALAEGVTATYTDLAAVKSSTPIYQQVNQPRQECWTEEITSDAPAAHDYGGTILGGLTGAILGAQVGKGGGRDAAIAIGAATGAVVGDQVGNKDKSGTVSNTRTERHCRYIDNWVQQVSGYTVIYKFNEREHKVVLPYDPGPAVQITVNLTPTGAAPRSGAGLPPPPPPPPYR